MPPCASPQVTQVPQIRATHLVPGGRMTGCHLHMAPCPDHGAGQEAGWSGAPTGAEEQRKPETDT